MKSHCRNKWELQINYIFKKKRKSDLDMNTWKVGPARKCDMARHDWMY